MSKQWVRQAAAAAAVVALLASAVGCSNDQEPKTKSQAEVPQEAPSNDTADPQGDADARAEADAASKAAAEELLQHFDRTLEEAGQAKDIAVFIDERIPEAPVAAADKMVSGLLAYYEDDIARVEKAFEPADVQAALMTAEWPVTLENAAQIGDERIRALTLDTLQGGYKLTMAEGYIFPLVDYGSWMRHAARLSPELADYIGLLALESDQPSVVDAGLTVSWDELGGRALQAETYLRTYPDAEAYAEVQKLFERYMAVYLQGVDNTPIYSYEGYRLSEEVEASYRKLASEHPGTAAAGAVNGYLELLESRDWRILEGDSAESDVAPELSSYWEGLRLMLDDLLHG
jgi:hypothetical protein